MSLQLALLNRILRMFAKPRLRHSSDPIRSRRDFDLFARLVFRAGRGIHIVRDPARSGCPELVWHTQPPVLRRGLILYFHGGGYNAGSPRTHRGLIAALARMTGLAVCAPAYGLAPERPLPAAFDDALAAWNAALARGHACRDIVIGGDSAGGGLGLALLAHLCQAGTPPAGAFVFSPWTDLTGSGNSVRSNADADPLLPAERMPDLAAVVLDGHPAADPRVSPMFADFPSCPRVLFQVSDCEILRDDTLLLAERLRGQSASVKVEVLPGTPHACQVFVGMLPEADAALRSVRRFVADCLAGHEADVVTSRSEGSADS